MIDDLSVARMIKGLGEPIHLAVSRSDVVSARHYESMGAFWRTVRRTAFAELRHSRLRLAATVAGLLLVFGVPPAVLVAGAAARQLVPGLLGLSAWAVMAAVYVPTVRLFRLPPAWALTLPLAGLLYGAMTVDSALYHFAGQRRVW